MTRSFFFLIAIASAGCISPRVAFAPPPLAYAPLVGSSYIATEALTRAEEAENEVRAERQEQEHAQMLRETWGIETRGSAAVPISMKPGDTGTGHELGTWDE